MVSETFKFESVKNAKEFIAHLKTNSIRGTFDFGSNPYTVTVTNAESITQPLRNLADMLTKEAVSYGKQIAPEFNRLKNEAVDLTESGIMHTERIVKPRYEQLKEFADQFEKKKQIDITNDTDDELKKIQAETDVIRNYTGMGNSTNYIPIEDRYGILKNDWFTIITNLKYPAHIAQHSKFLKGLGTYEPVAFMYLDEARNNVYGLVVQSHEKANNYYGYIIDVLKNSINEIGTYAHSLKDMAMVVGSSLRTYINEQSTGGITPPPKPPKKAQLMQPDAWVQKSDTKWEIDLEPNIIGSIFLYEGSYFVDILDNRPEFYGKRYMDNTEYPTLDAAKEAVTVLFKKKF